MKHKIDPSEYMVGDWQTPVETQYVRGSLHNKVGMWVMWTYYVLIIGMVIRLILVLNGNS